MRLYPTEYESWPIHRQGNIDFGAINRAALAALPAVLGRLLPHGKTVGRELQARNPRRTDRNPGSFKINRYNCRWADFATGDKGGDPISLVAYLEGVSQVEAARRLARMLGLEELDMNELPNPDKFARLTEAEKAATPAVEDRDDETARIAKARAIIKESVPIAGTPAAIYLRSRGIDPLTLPPSVVGWHAPSSAIVYVAKDGGGSISACQRVFLNAEGKKAGVKTPRCTNGALRNAAMCLPGEGETLACEGPEDALTLWRATNRPVRCAFGVSGLASIVLEPGQAITVCADNDGPGAAATTAMNKALATLTERGHAVKVCRPEGAKDANDLLIANGPDAVRSMVEGAKPFDASQFEEERRDWPEPKALPDGLLPVQAFDMDFLPATLVAFVQDTSERLQCPPDYVAIPLIVALGSLIGRKVGIKPQRRTAWTELANLWAVIVGRPGALKSPAMREVMKFLDRLAVAARESHEDALKQYEAQAEFAKLQKEDKAKKARQNIGLAVAGDLVVEVPEKPALRRYTVNDSTYEKLGEICAENPTGTLVFRDELVSLLKTLDREEQSAARGFYLQAWSGLDGYNFDRIIRGSTYLDAVCLSLLGSTQPGRLSEYIGRTTKKSAADDGLIQRFQLLVWPDQPPEWRNVDSYPDTAARDAVWDVFQRLDKMTAEDVGAGSSEFEKVPSLRFDQAAQLIFDEWRGDLERGLRSDELSPGLESHFAKYRGLIPALALINHLVDRGVGPVTETALLRALAFSAYLETHARRAYAAGSQFETAAAKTILAHIRNGDLGDGFTARDIQRRNWSNLTDRNDIQRGLDMLSDLDWIFPETPSASPARGRPPSDVYRVNPRVLK